MANFAINQVRHFYVIPGTDPATYVVTDITGSTVPEGAVEVVLGDDTLRFNYKSPGGLTGSDVIDIKNILYAKHTVASKMAYALKNTKVTVTNVVAGQEYIIKVVFRNFAGGGDDNITVKYGFATATSTDTVATLTEKLAKSLQKNLKDLVPLADVTYTATDLTITETEQDWKAGVKPFSIIPFEITLFPITKEGVEDYEWATLVEGTGVAVNNGKKIADMEWFHAGARGDYYRGYGNPHGVTAKLLADPDMLYDTLDIHYAYVGPNEAVQKSEKDITIAGENTVINAIVDKLTNIDVEEIA